MQNRKRDTDVQNRLLDSVGEGEGGMFWENSIESSILSRVKQITSPGWMHETSAWGWCTGKTQRDGMGREAGEGIGMGKICKSMADSCQCMAKTTTYCRVISLQLIKINGKKWKIKKIENGRTIIELCEFHFVKLRGVKSCQQYITKTKNIHSSNITEDDIYMCVCVCIKLSNFWLSCHI